MTRPCLPPRTHTSTPRWTPPPNSTDTHFHINGPYDTYPFSPGRSYTPDEDLVPDYLRMANTLSLQRYVIVQPSVFGTDNRCTLDAVQLLGPHRTRCVLVIDDTVDDAALRRFHEQGARGIRFNMISGNGTPIDQLRPLADRLAPLGWHIQFYLGGQQMTDLAPAMAELAVPVVLDHMAGVQADRGTNSPEFQAALALLKTGRAYVKLSGYRSSTAGPPYTDSTPLARAFIEAAPDQCLWGTDWPHPSLFAPTPMPDDGALFDLLGEWAPDAPTRHRILVDNPARLYGFDD